MLSILLASGTYPVTQPILEVAAQIRQKDDTLEHGTLIVGGEPLSIVTGTETSIPGVLFFIEPTILDMDLSELTGMIHSHPKDGNPEMDRLNQWPSDNDLYFAHQLCVIARKYGGDPEHMVAYIVGPDERLRAGVVECVDPE